MPILFKEKTHFKILEEQLTEYFEGKRKRIYRSATFCGFRFSEISLGSVDENSLW